MDPFEPSSFLSAMFVEAAQPMFISPCSNVLALAGWSAGVCASWLDEEMGQCRCPPPEEGTTNVDVL